MHRLQSSQLQRKEALVNSAQNKQDHDAAQKDASVLLQKFHFFQLTKVGKWEENKNLTRASLSDFHLVYYRISVPSLLLCSDTYTSERREKPSDINTAVTSFCQWKIAKHSFMFILAAIFVFPCL